MTHEIYQQQAMRVHEAFKAKGEKVPLGQIYQALAAGYDICSYEALIKAKPEWLSPFSQERFDQRLAELRARGTRREANL